MDERERERDRSDTRMKGRIIEFEKEVPVSFINHFLTEFEVTITLIKFHN